MIRLKELRQEKGWSMKETAKQLNLPYTTYVSYEKEEREPNSEALVYIANFFDITVDYLIGRSESGRLLGGGQKEEKPALNEESESAYSPRAMRIAEAYDRADERAQQVVDLTLEPYMSAPATKESDAKLA